MNNTPTIVQVLAPETVERVIMSGDLKRLTVPERLSYYKAVCDSVGLNPLTKPFDYLELNQKLVLYANKSCTDQLRSIHKVSANITRTEQVGDVFVVSARTKKPDGREDESTGAVNTSGLKGDALANAMMKAETKAKRRATLSICGLGMLDESEIDSIKDAKRVAREVAEAMPHDEAPAPPAPGPINSPWQYRLPTSWKNNGGMSLEELGVDGVVKLCGWLKSLDSLTDKNKEILWHCDQALRTKRAQTEEPMWEETWGEASKAGDR